MDFEHTIYTKKGEKKNKHGRMPQNEEFRRVEGEKHIQVEKKKYYEMDVLSLMQHEHRNHGFSVAATNKFKHTCLL